MNETLTKDLNGQGVARYWVAIALAGLSILTSLGRFYTRNEPLERDITTHAVVAHEMLLGQKLYTDVWDHKPPAIYIVCAAVELITGYGPGSVLLLNIAASLITLMGVYQAASLAGMGMAGGLWAAVLWSIVSLNLPLQANQPNTEVFINACMIWVFAGFVAAQEKPISYPKALWLGLLAAFATLFKHHAFLLFAGISIIYVIGTARTRQLRVRRFVSVLVAFGVIVFCWLTVVGYFALGGRFRDFYDAVFRHNMAIAGNTFYNLVDGLKPQRAVFLLMAVLPSAAAIGASFAGRLRRPVMPFTLMVGFAAGVFLAVSSTKWWFPHYFQLWLPALCVSLGWSYVLLGDMTGEKKRLRKFLPAIGAGIIVAPILVNQLMMYRLTPEQWAVKKYGEYITCYVPQAEEINRILKPSESFYHLGDDSGLYYTTKRRPPTSVIWYYPLFMGPLSESLSKRVVMELERSRPDMLVVVRNMDFSWMSPRWRENPIVVWCKGNYRPLPGNENRPYYALLARKGSNLERRIFGGQTK